MSNIKILFYGENGTEPNSIQVFANTQDGITIEIFNNLTKSMELICLSKKSAIRFSKEIRREIAVLNETEKTDDYGYY